MISLNPVRYLKSRIPQFSSQKLFARFRSVGDKVTISSSKIKVEEAPLQDAMDRILASEFSPNEMKKRPFAVKIYALFLKRELNGFYKSEEKHIANFLKKNKDLISKMEEEYQKTLFPMMIKVKNFGKLKNSSKDKTREQLIEDFYKKKKEIDSIYVNKFLKAMSEEYGFGNATPPVVFKQFEGAQVGGWSSGFSCIYMDERAYHSPKKMLSILFHEFAHMRQDFDILRKYGIQGYTKARMVRFYMHTKREKSPIKMTQKEWGRFVISMDSHNKFLHKLISLAEQRPMSAFSIRSKLSRIYLAETMSYKNAKVSLGEYYAQLLEKNAYFNAEKVNELFPLTNCRDFHLA